MLGTKFALTGRTVIYSLALTCALVAGRAAAGDHEVTVAIHATSDGLNLAQPADVRALYQRVKDAALVACTRADRVGLVPVSDVHECVENSLADAIQRANITALTEAYLDSHSTRVAAAHGFKLPPTLAAK